MRLFVLAITFALVLLPVLLILFAPGRRLSGRVIWAIVAFVSPLLVYGLVQMIPDLTNNAPEARQWARFIGLALSAAGFILPWAIFAVFLHRR
jgi:hypothetical protein